MSPAIRLSSRLIAAGTLMFGALFPFALPAAANDGGLATGGSPRLLNGHPSVTMTSEVINISVDKQNVKVDCQFVFTNSGPACTVRMGFPDDGYGAMDPDEMVPAERLSKTPPHSNFISFHSDVDGKSIPTKLVRSEEEGHFWHTKTVTFPAHSVRHIHDVYTEPVGGGIGGLKDGKMGHVSQIAYVVHTGASWHGNIGRTEINVKFTGGQIGGAPQFLPMKQVAKDSNGRDLDIASVQPGTIIWKGPCEPQVKGDTLQFVRSNWRPTAKDDLLLGYGFKGASGK